MKNRFCLLGIIVLAAIIGFAFTACDDGKPTGCTSHDWGVLTQTTAPGCTTAGENTQSCKNSGCNAINQDTKEVVNPLGHEGLTGAVPATCQASGNTETGTCTRCQQEVNGDEIPIDQTAHNWSVDRSLVRTGVEAKTCINDGCNEISDTNLTLALGDPGPAGGIIIYRLETGFTMTDDDSTAYYLEAAPANMATALRWSTLTYEEYVASGNNVSLLIFIPGTETAIGTGRKNTALILALDPTAPAALACKDYFAAGYESFNDWFLPSRDELNQLYLRRDDFGLSIGFFWSSSQNFIYYAWSQAFAVGVQYDDYKYYGTDVRAVRAF
ncbi:MAG: DUF1566 domain-containing protein [Treponema sp.]|nr:DUF1566 domain-containing protein [Treponema sp.]